jgi:hypothetical protein
MRRTIFGMVALSAAGCAAVGYTDRVLWRLPSPDGTLIAVCQEIPAFDGPGYDIRLEHPDGGLVRQLYHVGDGDPCSELAWSFDGRTLAILSSHVARIKVVDVAWALDHPSVRTSHWSWRQVDLSTSTRLFRGHSLRFSGESEIELRLCPVSRDERGRPIDTPCDASAIHRFTIPLPIVTGH